MAHFVRLNAAKVIIACRTPAKGAAAQADIEAARGRKGVVEVWQLDLESYDSIRAFVKRANALPRLDIMVNNAGEHTALTAHEYSIRALMKILYRSPEAFILTGRRI